MPLLTGLTADGTEVPVQVEPDGVLVAEGIQGPPGPEGPQGPEGPEGPPGPGDNYWVRSGTELSPSAAGDDVFTSGDSKVGGSTSQPNISLNGGDGSSTFNGLMTVNSRVLIEKTSGAALEITNGGDTKCTISNSGTFVNYDAASNEQCKLSSNGSATFTGDVTAKNLQSGLSNAGLDGDQGYFFSGTGGLNEVSRIRRNNSGSNPVLVVDSKDNVDAISFNSNGSASFAGTVTATVVPPSDVKFKQNVTPASPQLADVVALGNQLKNFDWNADAPVNDEIRNQRQLGLIAQDVQTVCPSLVKKIGPEEDPHLGISHDALIFKLLGAVTELSHKLDGLTSPRSSETRQVV